MIIRQLTQENSQTC